MSKTIVFNIKDGEVKVEASGFKGGACAVATKAFEEVLGGKVHDKKLKSEYYEKPSVTHLSQGAQ